MNVGILSSSMVNDRVSELGRWGGRGAVEVGESLRGERERKRARDQLQLNREVRLEMGTNDVLRRSEGFDENETVVSGRRRSKGANERDVSEGGEPGGRGETSSTHCSVAVETLVRFRPCSSA